MLATIILTSAVGSEGLTLLFYVDEEIIPNTDNDISIFNHTDTEILNRCLIIGTDIPNTDK